jgi:hypothetical protein
LVAGWKKNPAKLDVDAILQGHAKSTKRKAILNMQRLAVGLPFKEFA